MSKCIILSQFVRGMNLKPLKANITQYARQATAVSAQKNQYYDDEALEAAKPFEKVPSLLVLPWIGTGWAYLPFIRRFDTDLLKALKQKRKLFGDVFREKFGSWDVVISFRPDDLQTLFENEGPYPVRTELESIKAYRVSRKHWYPNLGLMLSQGKQWHDLRTKTQKHLLKPKAVQAFLDPMQDVARDFVCRIIQVRDSNKEVPEFLHELYKWALESVALVGLDSRLGCLESNLPLDSDGMRMIDAAQTQFECLNELEAFSGKYQFWKYFSTPMWKKFAKAGDTFTEISRKHINRSLDKLKGAKSEDRDLTLLQSMLMTKGMDASSATVIVIDMFLAGIDTTSHSVGLLLYHLARNPVKQELLHQHISSVLPRKEDRITPTAFNELRYLKACMKESQRLHPVVGGHARNIDHDVIFSGYRVPAGTTLMVPTQAIYRDEKYFSSPDEFQPERWLNKDEKFHPFAYLPFSFGTRSCIGRRLAELEIMCLTTELIRNFRVEYHHEDIGMYARFINTPDKPLRFNFIER